MYTILAGELRMKGEREQIVLAYRDGVSVDLGQNRDFGPVLGDPWGADEDRVDRPAVNPVHLKVGFKRVQLAAERVALRDHVEDSEVSAIEHDHAGTGTENRFAGSGKRT